MLLILSPSKTLDYETPHALKAHSQPMLLAESEKLVKKLRSLSQTEIAEMMELSEKLAALNFKRFKEWKPPFSLANARQAILAFKGDVYEGIEVEKYKAADFEFAQQHVRILSGLYGLLRPLDLMQPYRLEMGRKLDMGKTNDLYGFWGNMLSQKLSNELEAHKTPVLINLASEEYAKAVNRKTLKFPIIDIIFREKKDGKAKIIGLFAKRARGLMANYIINNQIDEPEHLKGFGAEGYRFDKTASAKDSFIFIR